MTYALLGWVSVGLLVLLMLPYVLIRLNKVFVKTRKKYFHKTIRFLRVLHKPAGMALLFMSAWHGFLALASVRLHTGTVLFVLVLVTALLGGAFYLLKNKYVFLLHKRTAAITVFFFLIHFFLPRALS